MPKAPSSIACRVSAFIASISSGVALRFCSPITFSRMLPCPTSAPKLMPICAASSLSKNGFSGKGELPSGPSITVVTPSRILFSAEGVSKIPPRACECVSRKPGATVRPAAFTVTRPRAMPTGPT